MIVTLFKIQKCMDRKAFSERFESKMNRLGDFDIAAIDAIDFRDYDPRQQFDSEFIEREIEKAYAGFYRPKSQVPIATGKLFKIPI